MPLFLPSNYNNNSRVTARLDAARIYINVRHTSLSRLSIMETTRIGIGPTHSGWISFRFPFLTVPRFSEQVDVYRRWTGNSGVHRADRAERISPVLSFEWVSFAAVFLSSRGNFQQDCAASRAHTLVRVSTLRSYTGPEMHADAVGRICKHIHNT